MPGFKDDLLKLAKSLNLTADAFDTVGIHSWASVLQKIEASFVMKTSSNTQFNWWWESFKGPVYRIFFENGQAYEYLDQLIEADDLLWFVACDTDRDPSKFWLFQGQVRAIQSVLREHYAFEYYLVSKKYEWLLCETDHSELIGLKSIIPKMQALRATIVTE